MRMDNEQTMLRNLLLFAFHIEIAFFLICRVGWSLCVSHSEPWHGKRWAARSFPRTCWAEKRKRRIIAKHVAIRLSFTITTTNFWRPDMNDCSRRMRGTRISPTFVPIDSRALVRSRFSLSSTWCVHINREKNSHENCILSRHSFPLSAFPAFPLATPPHCLCDTLVHYRLDFRSFNINLRVVSCSQSFLSFPSSGSFRRRKKNSVDEYWCARKLWKIHHFHLAELKWVKCLKWKNLILKPIQKRIQVLRLSLRKVSNWHTKRAREQGERKKKVCKWRKKRVFCGKIQ